MLIHAYQELLDALLEYNKVPDDILWVSVREGEVDKTLFWVLIEETWYENNSQYGELNASLVLCGKDFCIRRTRIDEHECWEYMQHLLPVRPTQKAQNLLMWTPNNREALKITEEDNNE